MDQFSFMQHGSDSAGEAPGVRVGHRGWPWCSLGVAWVNALAVQLNSCSAGYPQVPAAIDVEKKKLCSMWVPLLWPPIQDISVTSAVAEFALGLRLIKAFREPSIRSQERKLPAFRLVNLRRADGRGTLVAQKPPESQLLENRDERFRNGRHINLWCMMLCSLIHYI